MLALLPMAALVAACESPTGATDAASLGEIPAAGLPGDWRAPSVDEIFAIRARVEACGLNGEPPGMGACALSVYLTQELARSLDTAAVAQGPRVDCMRGATDCDTLRACVAASPAEVAACPDGGHSSICFGDARVRGGPPFPQALVSPANHHFGNLLRYYHPWAYMSLPLNLRRDSVLATLSVLRYASRSDP